MMAIEIQHSMKAEDINQEQRDVITTMLIDNFDEDFRTNNNNNNSNHKIVYSNAEQTTLTAIKENFINGHKGSKVTGYISFNEFRLAIFRSLKQIRTLVQETSFYPSLRPSYKKATNNNRDEKSHARNNSSTATDKDKSKQSKLCKKCERYESKSHIIPCTTFDNHPDVNKQSVDFLSSENGKHYKDDTKPFLVMGRRYDVTSRTFKTETATSTQPPKRQNENSKDNNNNQKRGRNGKQKSYCEYIYNISENNTMTKPIVHAQININNNNLQISNCLIDSGAMQGNYVNGKVAEWLTRHNATIIETKKRICSCFHECRIYNNVFVNKISFENVNNNKIITFETNFTVIPELQFEVVIGYPDITKYDLFKIINKTNIMTDTTGVTTGDFVEATHRQSKQTTAKVAQLTVVDLLDTRIVATPHSSSEVYTPKLDETLGKPIHISEYLDYEPGSDGIPWNYSSLDETLHSEHIHTTNEHTNIQSNIPTDIRGTISLKTRVNALLTSYSDVFSKTL